MKYITVEKISDIENKIWKEVFHPNAKIKVKKETKIHWIIDPLGFDMKVTKSTGYLLGFKKNSGVKFSI